MPLVSNPIGIGPKWLERRQLGIPISLGSRNLQYKQQYDYNDSTLLSKTAEHGAIFSLEYNPEGSVLVAATERKNVLLFDPLRCVPILTISNAHDDCVNCIKFIDSRYFATCSDDRTVSIWDMRNLSSRLFHLDRHSNWVKSIEYSKQDNVLLTSGFDGDIYTWGWSGSTIGSPTKIFSINGLMRSCLSKDASKLVLSTAGGYMMVVHNLNLLTFKKDLINFKPNIYRLMQLSQTNLYTTQEVSSLFTEVGKRNRVEFISDFPPKNASEIISSIQIHPEGNCLFSRNTSQDESSEWSCVHDIEEWKRNSSDTDENMQVGWPRIAPRTQRPTTIIMPPQIRNNSPEHQDLTSSPNDIWEAIVAINAVERGRARLAARDNSNSNTPRRLNIQYRDENDGLRNLRTRYEMNETVRLQTSSVGSESQVSFSHDLASSISERVVSLGVFRTMRDRGTSLRRHNVLSIRVLEENAVPSTSNFPSDSSSFLTLHHNKDIHQNYRRLIFYIQEPNVALGFIKECSFSPDGRVICSPYGSSVRLLAFSPKVVQPWQCFPDNPPSSLHVIWSKGFHEDHIRPILSTKFSVLDNSLAVGTLAGAISIYYPFR